MSPPGDQALVVEQLCAGYGSMQVVTDVSLRVDPGQTVALVGRNGAGKTTTVNALAGLRYGRASGRIRLGDRDLSGLPAARVVAAGLALVPAGHRVFSTLSVAENLRLGAFCDRRRLGPAELGRRLERVVELFPVLGRYAGRPAGVLSGGEQQMAAIGQALMSQPEVLVLDEPTSGLAPAVIESILAALDALAGAGMGVLFVEQNVERALARSGYCYVLDGGRVVLSGPSAELAAGEQVAAVVSGMGPAPGPS
jgi:branched-chain amino acid transport system ATP-binding protein